MGGPRKPFRSGLLVAFTFVVVGVLGEGSALASTGVRTLFWSGSGVVLSTTSSLKYSNASAFWQALANSEGGCLAVDGIFGSLTKAETINVQNSNGVTPANGVVNITTWNAMQFAQYFDPVNNQWIYRHQPTGYTDGFGTQ
jgi:peptidoglycan hydrolase-like protein with peptidoglycan-binding domain